MVAASTSGSKSLIEYLKRYESNDEEGKEKKKRTKNVVQSKPDVPHVLVVDEDPVCHKPVNLEEKNNDDSAHEEKPQVDEDIEVKQMKRLKQLKAMRPYNAISEDGSGWVSLSPKAANSNDPNPNMSPLGKPAVLNDTPSLEHELKLADFGRGSADLSPSGQQLKHQQNDTTSDFLDISPPRRRSHGSLCQDDFQDLSPLRKSRKEAVVNEQHKTGLLTGKEISEEIARTKKTDWLRFKEMDRSISGQGAVPV
ncbi:uncharacterized protein LOC122276953 [Carya illinoinensis]|uniref:uncharacterized protein LOC122276953 n=1 Tax=Carya illinoinensis TaxID=32201 RepID=UPI001C71E661|nr:uncharacterized protein LOC122276953 [Carya illinoinensis]